MPVYIYILILSDPEFKYNDQLLDYVSLERQKKIQRYYKRTDQLLSMYAELIVRMGINKQYHVDLRNQEFKVEDNGKPYLVDFPSIYFNLSHSKRCVLCAISEQCLGVDVEKIENAPFEIMDKFFHEDEIAYINGTKTKWSEHRFFEIWTKKEAYVKYDGKGLRIDLAQVNTVKSKLYGCYVTLHIDDNYICSIYTEEAITPIIVNLTEQNIYDFYSVLNY